MEVTDLTEMSLDEAEKVATGPLKIHDVSNVSPFEQRAAAAQKVVEETTQATENVAKPGGLPKGYLSYSQIDLFMRCKFAYWCRYWAKRMGADDKVAAAFGKLIHIVLEHTYRWIKETKYRGKFPTDKAFEFLKRFWADPKEGMSGSDPKYWMDARDILRKYSQENAFIDYSDVVAVELGDLYDAEGNPIPNANIGGVPIVAKLDLLLRVRDPKTKILKIRDYKTDRMMRYREDVDRDLQLGIYDIVVRQAYPTVEVVELELYMLRHGVTQTSQSRTPDQRGDVEAFVAEIAHEISTETEWPAKLNEFCHWCDHKGTCQKYSEALEGGAGESAILAQDLAKIGNDPSLFAEMFNRRDEYNNRRGVLDRRKSSYDKALKAFLDRVPGAASGRDPITVGDREFYVFTQRRFEYKDRLQVVELLAKRLSVHEGFVDALICKIQKTSIDEALKKLLAGTTVGEVFDFTGEGSDNVVASAFVEMVKIELESIAEVSHSTRLVSRASKASKAKKKKQEEATRSIPMVTDAMVNEARAASKTGYVLTGQKAKEPEPAEPAEPIASHTRTPVNSAHLRSVGYEPESGTLQIEFTDRGVYNFLRVPPDVHACLMAAPSKGGFFKGNIKKAFRYEKTTLVGFDRPVEVSQDSADPMWKDAANQGVKPAGVVSFDGASDDYIDPAVALGLWRKASGGKAAQARPGLIRSHVTLKTEAPVAPTPEPPQAPEVPPPAPDSGPAPQAQAPAQAPAPAAEKKRKRAPMSQATKDKIAAGRKLAWEKKKRELGQA